MPVTAARIVEALQGTLVSGSEEAVEGGSAENIQSFGGEGQSWRIRSGDMWFGGAGRSAMESGSIPAMPPLPGRSHAFRDGSAHPLS